ncbi:MAG: hypothetical protein NTU61_04845, partial [Candidatus Altiarchaeota archaeon]|nr:hypothetical protein [Candidatus Altiarchaeota archaeon]
MKPVESRQGPLEQPNADAERIAREYEDAVRRAREKRTAESIFVYCTPSVKVKLDIQHFFYDARAVGGDNPHVVDEIREIITGGRFIADFNEKGLEDRIAHMKEVVDGKRDLLVAHISDDKSFETKIREINDSLARGDVRPAVRILGEAARSMYPDELLYYASLVDDYIASRGQEDPRPAGWSELIAATALAKANPLVGRDRSGRGLDDKELGLVEMSIRELKREFSRNKGRLNSTFKTYREGEVEDTAWKLVDVMGGVSKHYLIERLGRIQESNLPEETKKWGMMDAIGRSFRVDVETQMLSWLEKGGPELFLRNFSSVDNDIWSSVRLPEGGLRKLRDLVAKLPDDERGPFLNAFVRMRKTGAEDLRVKLVEVVDRLVTNLAGRPDDLRTMLKAQNFFQHYTGALDDVVDEMDMLSFSQKGDLRGSIGHKIKRATVLKDAELDRLEEIDNVRTRVDPVKRLPSVAELLISYNIFKTADDGKPGWDFLRGTSIVASNHESLRVYSSLVSPAAALRQDGGVPDESGVITLEPDFRGMLGELSQAAAQSYVVCEQVRARKEFTDYVRKILA